MNADEAELEDVTEQMEQQLYQQYMQVGVECTAVHAGGCGMYSSTCR
jgi:hypothetical protein